MKPAGFGFGRVNVEVAGLAATSFTPGKGTSNPPSTDRTRIALDPEKPVPQADKQKAINKLLSHSGAQHKLNGAKPNHDGSVLAAALQDSSVNAHDSVVERYFRNINADGGGANIAQDSLKAAIANAVPDFTNPLDKAEHMVYLTLALAGATGSDIVSRNPSVAAHVIRCLQQMDLANIIRGTATVPDAPADLPAYISWNTVQRCAWKTAYGLATCVKGYATLQLVANCNAAGIDASDVGNLKTFLNAANHKLAELAGDTTFVADVAPASLLAHSRNNRSLVGDALRGEHAVLGGTSWDDLCENSLLLAYASNAVRNGFLADGPGSDLHKAMKRSNKMIVWEGRAIDRYNNPKSDTKTRRLNIILPNKSKSPLSAMLNAGDVRNLHSHCIGESKAAEVAWNEILQAQIDLRTEKLRTCIANAMDGDEDGDENKADKLILIDTCVIAAILEAFVAFRGLRGRYQGRPMQPGEIAEARKQLSDFAADNEIINATELLEAFDRFVENPVVLDAETLQQWASNAFLHLYSDQDEAESEDNRLSQDDERRTDWNRLDEVLARLRGNLEVLGLAKYLENDWKLTLEGLINYLKDVVGGCELGSSLTTTAGYTVGVTSKNFLTATLSDVLYTVYQTAIPIAIGGQFSATGGSEAYVNLGLTATGLAMELGTQKKGKITIGVSAFAGYHLKTKKKITGEALGVTAGGSAGLAASYEESSKNAVVLRLGRTGTPYRPGGLAGDTQAKEEFKPIIDDAMTPLTEEEKAQGIRSPLQKVLARHNGLSVTYQNDKKFRERKIRGAGSAGVSISGSAGSFRTGLGANVVATTTYLGESWQVNEEQQGRTRITQEKAVQDFELSGGVGLTAASAHMVGNNAFRTIGTGSADISGDAVIYKRSMMVKRIMVFSDGEIDPSSFVSYTHQTADGFAESVLNRIDIWTDTEISNMLQQMDAGKRPAEGTPEYEVIRDEAHETIRQFVARALSSAEPYKTYTEWLNLIPDKAKEINKHLTNAKLAKLANDMAEAEKEDEIGIRIQRDPDSWNPVLLFSAKLISEKASRGLPNLGLIANSWQGLDVSNLDDMT